VLIFAFIIASSERGRGGVGFGGRLLRFFVPAKLVGRSCDRGREGERAGPEAARKEGKSGRVFAMNISDDCASHQSSIASEVWSARMRAHLHTCKSHIPFLQRYY
jgi:hypothetical protein